MDTQLHYQPPLDWAALLEFLAGRAIGGVEVVRDDSYARTAQIAGPTGESVTGWLRVTNRPAESALIATLSDSLLPVKHLILARLRRLFDLDCEPDRVTAVLRVMNDVIPGSFVPGVRVPGCFDEFELVTRAVLGQQVSVRAASTLATRIVQGFGAPLETPVQGLTHTFPTPATVLGLAPEIENHFGILGVTSSRSRTIAALAAALAEGEIDFQSPNTPDQITKLMEIKGIGAWTANYIAMRAMAWPDAFLETDVGVKRALAPRTPAESLQLAEAWRPWRSYATFSLWHKTQGAAMYRLSTHDSPIGTLSLATDEDALVGLWPAGNKYFGGSIRDQLIEAPDQPDTEIITVTRNWLDNYFAGNRPDLGELKLRPIGTQFRQQVWEVLQQVPYGQTTTYRDIAAQIAASTGRTTMSSQAVGGAVGHNPISIIIPCHRVVGADGSLAGYASGLAHKIALLELEGCDMSKFFVPTRGTAL